MTLLCGGESMATKSFLKEVVIKDPKLVNQFVNTLEEAEESAKKNKIIELSRPCIELKEEDIKAFFNIDK